MKTISITDIGSVRKTNEDSCASGDFSENSSWVVVCDGMGGVNGGEVASEMAVKAVSDYIIDGFDENLSSPNIKSLMINALSNANRIIFEYSKENPNLRGMGTTVVLMIATKGVLHVAHIGDSRAYTLTELEGFQQITMDHSYVQDLVNFGQITQNEARVHPQRNIITRVLGVHEQVQCDYSSFDFPVGSVALACSDGLTNYVEENVLEDYIRNYYGESLVSKLIDYANKCGGGDNITVAVINNK